MVLPPSLPGSPSQILYLVENSLSDRPLSSTALKSAMVFHHALNPNPNPNPSLNPNPNILFHVVIILDTSLFTSSILREG